MDQSESEDSASDQEDTDTDEVVPAFMPVSEQSAGQIISSALTSPEKVTLAEWNYEADFELLKIKLSQAPVHEKEKARDFIERYVHGSSTNKGEPGQENGNQKLRDHVFHPDPDLKSSVIKKTCALMVQFQKFYRDLELQAENAAKADPPLQGEDGTPTVQGLEMNNKYDVFFEDLRLEDLQNVLTSFELFCKVGFPKPKEPSRAFGMDLIIQEILQYLPRSDLLNCRVVNKNWNRNAIVQFYKHSDFYVCDFNQYEHKMTYFCDEVEDVPAGSMFNRIEVKLDEDNPLEDCVTFFDKIGHQLKYLKICERFPEDYDDVEEEERTTLLEYQLKLRTVFQSIPKLEHLVLWNIPQDVLLHRFVFTPHELKESTLKLEHVKKLELWLKVVTSQEFLDGLFSLIPNVTSCEFKFHPTQDFTKLISSLSKLRLTTLKIVYNLMPAKEFCSNMRRSKLKVLKMIVRPTNNEEVQAYEEYLRSQSYSLEELYLEFLNSKIKPVFNTKIKLPKMWNLNSLNLNCGSFPLLEIESKNIPICRKVLVRNLDSILFFSSGGGDGFPSVEEFYICGLDIPLCLNFELLTRIEATFPNLKILSNSCIHMCDEALEIIFSLRNLEALYLKIYETNLKKNISLILSGFTAESALIASKLMELNSPALASIEPPLPSLQNLRRLKTLKLGLHAKTAYPRNKKAFAINELCVHFGFLALPRLEYFKLVGDFTIPKECVAELSKHHFRTVVSPSEPMD